MLIAQSSCMDYPNLIDVNVLAAATLQAQNVLSIDRFDADDDDAAAAMMKLTMKILKSNLDDFNLQATIFLEVDDDIPSE